MDSKFNIAIIVLVVLSQLGGALIKMWRKRQVPADERRQGGIVVIPSSQPSKQDDSWSRTEAKDRTGSSSWESPESQEPPDAYWEDHVPGELDNAPASTRTSGGYQHPSAPIAALIQRLGQDVVPVKQVASVGRAHPVVATRLAHEAGTLADIPRGRALLKRTTLRNALIAQFILVPPSGARRLRR